MEIIVTEKDLVTKRFHQCMIHDDFYLKRMMNSRKRLNNCPRSKDKNKVERFQLLHKRNGKSVPNSH